MTKDKLEIKAPAAKPSELCARMMEIDVEFRDFLASMVYKKSVGNISTYSPLDAVEEFKQDGLQAIREPNREEMLGDGDGMKKLLANMLALCQPGSLSEADMEQLSGINGREIATGQI